MVEFFEFMLGNKYYSLALLALLVVLLIVFFCILFNTKDENIKTEVKKKDNDHEENYDAKHEDYVKETTAEFELIEINEDELSPTPDEVMPEIKEESPAYNFSSQATKVSDEFVTDFSFDKLSQMIMNSFDKIDENTDQVVNEDADAKAAVEQVVTDDVNLDENDKAAEEVKIEDASLNKDEENNEEEITDAFKEVTPFTSVEVTNIEEIDKKNYTKNNNAFSSVFVNKDVISSSLDKITLDKKEVVEEKNEPILKDNDVPLFARFENETYDLTNK